MVRMLTLVITTSGMLWRSTKFFRLFCGWLYWLIYGDLIYKVIRETLYKARIFLMILPVICWYTKFCSSWSRIVSDFLLFQHEGNRPRIFVPAVLKNFVEQRTRVAHFALKWIGHYCYWLWGVAGKNLGFYISLNWQTAANCARSQTLSASLFGPFLIRAILGAHKAI